MNIALLQENSMQICILILIYTAVTRAKKMVVLVGEKKNLKRMVGNVYTAKRFTMLADFLVAAHDKAIELFG